ncbi:MAG: AAA family ATPase [Saprospiraceae bacterium]
MRIKNIKIKNYRGILDEEIEFNKQVNVFIGGNGAGKTTLLEAIVACLLKIINSKATPSQNRNYTLTNKDINYHKTHSSLLALLEFSSFNKTWNVPLSLKIGLNQTPKSEIGTLFTSFKVELNNKLSNSNFTLPIVKYYLANRNAISYHQSNSTSTKIYQNPILESWDNFIHDKITYSKFFKWFSENEIQELRLQRDEDSFEYKSPIINNVRIAIQKAFKKLNGKDYLVKSEAIKRNGTNQLVPTIALQEKRSKVKEILDNKSAGEKAIITLIADIAYNLSIAHNFSSNEDFLKGSGIVLIDEIEAHLHPSWQRKIIPLLTDLFPNIQFFITTHSPQAIASVNSQNIFICDNFKFRKIDFKSKGMDSNTLLTTFFDTNERPTEYAKLISEFRDMMDANADIDKLEKRIKEIEALNQDDEGEDQSQLIEELRLELAAHKFDLEHEIN